MPQSDPVKLKQIDIVKNDIEILKHDINTLKDSIKKINVIVKALKSIEDDKINESKSNSWWW